MAIEQAIFCPLDVDEATNRQSMLKLTVGEMNTLQHARWLQLLRATGQWVKDSLGVDDGEDSTVEGMSESLRARRESGYRRATMLAALKKVEIGTCAVDEKEPQEWQPSDLPLEWQGIDNFIDNVPSRLFDLWLVVAIQCNPGVFYKGSLDEQKKSGQGQPYARKLTKRLTFS